MHHHTQLISVYLVEMRFHHFAQACLKLLDSTDLPASVSQSAGVTGLSHCMPVALVRSYTEFSQQRPALPTLLIFFLIPLFPPSGAVVEGDTLEATSLQGDNKKNGLLIFYVK